MDLRSIQHELDYERRRLAELDRLRAEVLERIALLEAEAVAASALAAKQTLSAQQKIDIFRSLFRGRDDVYPQQWVSKKTNKLGYSPVCANEWLAGICNKPKIACSECKNQDFKPVTDVAIDRHLRGHQTLGVYPLLKDDTCWFLAMDFDGESWMEDVQAVLATCRQLAVPCSVERSRSGNGAHVWFFFEAAVPAEAARQMGCYLVTLTMSRRHQLSMKSYDRLFPNQDTLPTNGFGNLIALPLQRKPREQGNSVFLDDSLSPYPDQWAYLSSISRLSAQRVHELALEGQRRGQVIDARVDTSELRPWERPPSGGRPAGPPTPRPDRVRAVLAQRLFIEKSGLSEGWLAFLKKLAAFQNPEFYKRQAARRSIHDVARVISCSEDMGDYLALPRGCLIELRTRLAEAGVPLELEDCRVDGTPLEMDFLGTLSKQQEAAVAALLAHDFGLFIAPPATGKTVVGAALVARRKCSTLILVHRQPLIDQWRERLVQFLGVKPKEIGQVGGGRRKPNGRLDIATIQSLIRDHAVDDCVASYGQIIVDECHHVPAVSFEKVIAEAKARFLVGLTATPQRKDGHHPILEMQLGPVRFQIEALDRAQQSPFAHHLIIRETAFQASLPDLGYQELCSEIAVDPARNQMLLGDCLRVLADGRAPLVLTERKEHLEWLAERLAGQVRHVFVLQGGMRKKARKQVLEGLAATRDEGSRVLLATGKFAGEGFDDPRLDTLILSMPISWKGTLVQYAGRLHRHHPDKLEVRIYDYVDARVPVLQRMFQKRLKGYRAMGYSVQERTRQPDQSADGKSNSIGILASGAVLGAKSG